MITPAGRLGYQAGYPGIGNYRELFSTGLPCHKFRRAAAFFSILLVRFSDDGRSDQSSSLPCQTMLSGKND
jgi:hypothetical protein